MYSPGKAVKGTRQCFRHLAGGGPRAHSPADPGANGLRGSYPPSYRQPKPNVAGSESCRPMRRRSYRPFTAMLERSCPCCLFFALLLGACSASNELAGPAGTGGAGNVPPPDARSLSAPTARRFATAMSAKVCDGQGGFASTTACEAECKDGLGCVRCVPNAGSCASAVATVCDATGTNENTFACEGPGMTCDADGCHGECSPVSLGMGTRAASSGPLSPPTACGPTARTSRYSGFHFGVLLGNVSATSAAQVWISGPTSERSFTLAAR